MPLRQTVLSSPETLSDLLLAADDRYREAEELLVAQELDGCVYLFGYSVEMWLKSACLRLRGHGPVDQVMAALPPLKSWMKHVAPATTFTSYHDLNYLGACVLELRLHQARPVVGTLLTDFRARILTAMHDGWIVDMRYRRSGLTAQDAWDALVNAWWMKQNWTSLT